MGHKHAKEMMMYAEDAQQHERPWELWDWQQPGVHVWISCKRQPTWRPEFEYRRRPRFVCINGHQVTCPVQHAEDEAVIVLAFCRTVTKTQDTSRCWEGAYST